MQIISATKLIKNQQLTVSLCLQRKLFYDLTESNVLSSSQSQKQSISVSQCVQNRLYNFHNYFMTLNIFNILKIIHELSIYEMTINHHYLWFTIFKFMSISNILILFIITFKIWKDVSVSKLNMLAQTIWLQTDWWNHWVIQILIDIFCC